MICFLGMLIIIIICWDNRGCLLSEFECFFLYDNVIKSWWHWVQLREYLFKEIRSLLVIPNNVNRIKFNTHTTLTVELCFLFFFFYFFQLTYLNSQIPRVAEFFFLLFFDFANLFALWNIFYYIFICKFILSIVEIFLWMN